MGATEVANLLQREWFHSADGRVRRVEEGELFNPGGRSAPVPRCPVKWDCGAREKARGQAGGAHLGSGE